MSQDIYSRIRQAAFELVNEGIWPTVVEVRQRLGSGSNTTINNTLKSWRQEFLMRMGNAARRPDWPAGLAEAFEQVWQRACDGAEESLAGLKAEVEQERLSQQESMRLLHQQLASSELDRQRLEEMLEKLMGEAQSLQQRLGESEAAVARQQALLEVREQALMQLQQQLESNHQQHAKHLEELQLAHDKSLAEARSDAERREVLAYERLEGVRGMLYQQLDNERQGWKQQQQRLEGELQSARRGASEQLDQLQLRLLEAESERARLQEQGTQFASQLQQYAATQLKLEQDSSRQQSEQLKLAAELARHQQQAEYLNQRWLPQLAERLLADAASYQTRDAQQLLERLQLELGLK